MENKHIIALILIIILAFVVAFVGLTLASNHSTENPVINASTANDSENVTAAPVISTSSDDSDASDLEEDTDVYDPDTYDDTDDTTYDDTYVDSSDDDYDYDYDDYLDEDYDDYADDY